MLKLFLIVGKIFVSNFVVLKKLFWFKIMIFWVWLIVIIIFMFIIKGDKKFLSFFDKVNWCLIKINWIVEWDWGNFLWFLIR